MARFLYYYAASLAHSRLISPPQSLTDMRKCPTISPDPDGEVLTKMFTVDCSLSNKQSIFPHLICFFDNTT